LLQYFSYFCLSIVANMRFLRPILLLFFVSFSYVVFGQSANDDELTTDEDVTASVNVLSNDFLPLLINAGSVDLDPSADRQTTFTTDRGIFNVDDSGVVTFVPTADLSGQTQVSYTFKNVLGVTSNTAILTVTINPVNDAPVITGQNEVTMPEAGTRTLAVTDLIIDDGDDTFPGGFSLSVQNGTNYTVSGTTITAAANFVGTLTVPVSVNDGDAESNVFNLQVTVSPVNDVPVITGQNDVTMQEDGTRTLAVTDLIIDDSDDTFPGGFSLLVQNGTNYTVSGTTITPAANFAGTLTVPVTVHDGDAESNVFNLQVTVSAVNDAPVITGQLALETSEDTPIPLVLENLIVTDIDNTYPTGFTLHVQSGSNYTVQGTTVTPNTNFTGTLSVPVSVNDGTIESAAKTITISVRAVNDAPVITGQNAISMAEDASRVIQLADLKVTDSDNSFPTGFSLSVLDGTSYTVNGTSITPALNFNGALTVNVKVNDGTDDSNVFGLKITVTPVNDAPVITGQQSISVAEAQPIPLNLSMLTVTDPDDSYPNDFTLSIYSGANYSVTGNVVTPVANFSGTLQVRVVVNDGTVNSADYNLQIQVNSTNDAPVITGQNPLQTSEEQAITLQLTDLKVTDPDSPFPTGFSLIVAAGSNYSVSGQTVTPANNFTGTLSVSVRVNDGFVDSAPFPLQITVTPVNDAPVITGQQALTTPEDRALTLEFANLTVSDPDNVYPNGFTMSVADGTNYSVSGRTITPDQNFNGTLTVPVTVNDGSVSSASFNVKVTVTPVNDAPVITGQNTVATTEDTPITILLTHLVVTDIDNTFPTGFSLTVQPGTNYTVGTGNRITPASNFTGTLSVSVTVSDGAASSAPFALQVAVTGANDPPVITGQNALSVQEDQSITLKLGDLTVTDPDNTYPEGFSLLITAGTNYTVSGLTITPTANFSGTLTVPVRVNDGTNNSAPYNLQIQVTQINDAPGFAVIANQEVTENSGQHKITITGVTKGLNENSQQLTWVASSSNTDIISLPATPISFVQTATTAILTYDVQSSRAGTVTISITVVDNGSGVAPNVNTYTQSFTITVSETNDAPTLDPINPVAIQEDAPLQTIPLTGITAGPQETQDLTVKVESNKPALFEILDVVYTSPQREGTIRYKPAANANGSALITVTVTDSGLGSPPPNVNFIKRSFTLTIQPVNDSPVFLSTPIISVSVGELYEYEINVTDADGETIALTAPVKPAWLAFTNEGNGKARLKGTPPEGVSGATPVRLSAKDPGGSPVLQEFNIVINARPVVKPITIQSQEDKVVAFTLQQFRDAFADADNDPLKEITITALPKHGTMRLNGGALQGGESILIPAASINQITYTPVPEYSGVDTLRWNASDGVEYSRNATYVNIVIQAVNDVPVVDGLETDSLEYEVGNETPRFITETFQAVDVDDDSLASAEVGFRRQNHNPLNDRLLFTATSNITAVFDSQAGILSLTGKAPLAEYTTVIRSIQYNYVDLTQLALTTKNVYITLNDGKGFSETKDRPINLIYTFKDLDIPTGFTPNGDNANDLWKISSVKGVEQFKDAEIRVYDRRGVMIYEATGFDRPWDGTYQGQRLPVDSYFYTIDLKYNRIKYKGVVTILR